MDQTMKKKLVLLILLTVFDQIFGSRRSVLLFLTTGKGPRAAKISWRDTLWSCLIYKISQKVLNYEKGLETPAKSLSKDSNCELAFLTFD
jgi:hypothetical protein